MRKEITAGLLLSEARQERVTSFSQIANETFITEEALHALEKNDFAFFNSRLNAEGLAKKYAEFLGLDTQYIASLVRRDYVLEDVNIFTSYNPYAPNFGKKFDLWWWAGMVIILTAILFFSYQIYRYVLPPSIVILEPSAKSFKRVEKVGVKGKVDKESEVIVNGSQANVTSEGIFSADVKLSRGTNNIQIIVTGTNGRKTIKNILIVNE